MKSGEGLGVLLAPRDLVNAPSAFAVGVFREERGGGEVEQVPADEEIEPLAKFRPGLSLELGFGIGCDDAAGIRRGGEGPEDDPADAGGLADAVAGSSADLDCFVRGKEAELD